MTQRTPPSPPVAAPRPPRRRHVLSLLPIAALAACTTVGPNHQAPTVPWSPTSWLLGHPAPPKLPNAPPPSVPTEASPDPSWWALFRDDELTALEQRVASGNLDVQAAGQRLLESRAALGVSAAALFPTAEASAAATREQLSKNGVLSLTSPTASTTTPSSNTGGAGSAENAIFKPFNVFQTGFDATWEIDFWGHARRGVESAEAAAAAAAEGQRGVLLAAEAEVARDYIRLRGVQQNLRITEDNLRIAEKSLNLTQQRAAGGVTTDLDVANASALVATISAQIPALEAQRDDLIDAIGLLLGEPPQAMKDELVKGQPIPPVPPRVPIGLPSDLARRRPDIRQAEATLHEATANVGVAVADFYPRIILSGSIALQATQLNDLGNWGKSDTWALGPTLYLPIFEGGRLHRTLELRERQQQEAAIAYRRAVLTALHEVDAALTDYAAEQRRRDQLAIAVEQNKHAVALAQDRYAQGVSTFLDVLDAQRSLLAAEQSYTDSTTTIATNLVALYKALGGGWQAALPDEPPPPEPRITLDNLLE